MDEVSHLRERERNILIGVCTYDFSQLHDLIRILKERHIPHALLEPSSIWEAKMDCLILDRDMEPPSFSLTDPPVVDLTSDANLTVERAIATSFGKSSPHELIAGIDPGKRPGIAFLADGTLISARRSAGPGAVVEIMLSARRAYMPETMLVRVGDGDPGQGEVILSDLRGAGFRTELVDESKTTRTKRYRDENAAVLIARTPGEPY